jgi:hypothetical protein
MIDDPATARLPEIQGAGDGVEVGDPDRLPELSELPREVGYILLSAGVLGFVLPGPGTPAIIAGGLVLWPGGFGKAEGWFRRRYPSLHREGMQHIYRFLKDLEGRYPGTLRGRPAGPSRADSPE